MKIVMGIDDAPCSLAALNYLESMPWARKAEWRLLSVVQVPTMVYEIPGVAGAEAMEAMEAQKTVQQEWLAGKNRLLRENGIQSQAIVDEGDARTSLIQAVRDERADLLVVGSHGRTGITRLLLGSVAGYVVAHAPCSVLVVKGARRTTAGRPITVLIGIDDSPYSQEAVQWVRTRSWPADTRIHLLSAVAAPSSHFVESNSVALRAAREQANVQEELVSRYERSFRDSGFVCESTVPKGDARIELETAAQRLEADLLVVGSHGRFGLSKLMLGSVAGHLVAHAACSVLVVKRMNGH
jgi:nucleotide-binding universal stress UspA family protein